MRMFARLSPETPASIAAFPTGDISPHILAAPSKARCAFMSFAFIIHSYFSAKLA